ncbi:MAG TPA: AEC family transporter [Anaerolineae bacterium]|nr:AEC family transporter [Anaerolineae bacterium]
MIDILAALVPIFCVIILGTLLRYLNFPGDAFWPLSARLVYFVLFPALLVNTLAPADLSNAAVLPLGLNAILAVMTIAVGLVLIKLVVPLENRAFTSIFQGAIRHNTYVGLAAAASLFGPPGVALTAILLAFIIPLVNVLCVSALSYYNAETKVSLIGVIKSMAKNPLILACAVGIGLNLTGLGLPLGSGEVLAILSRAALPLGLLIVGAGLNLGSITQSTPAILFSSGLKLILYPWLIASGCTWLGVTGDALAIVVLFGSLPTATSAYILAIELGGDARLMAAIITGQTLFAAATMPLVLIWLT